MPLRLSSDTNGRSRKTSVSHELIQAFAEERVVGNSLTRNTYDADRGKQAHFPEMIIWDGYNGNAFFTVNHFKS